MYKIQTIHSSLMRVCDSMKTPEGVTIPIIGGITSLSDVVSGNGYRYKGTFWPKVLSQKYVKDMIAARTSLGTIEHPEKDEDYMRTPYLVASHVVIDAVLNGNNPDCKFALFNNEYGNCIKALVDVKVPVKVSTRGLGDTLKDSISPYIDEDNYGLITWDIVNNPNFEDISLQRVSDSVRSDSVFKELVEAYSLRDSVNTDYDRLLLLQDINRACDHLKAIKDRLLQTGLPFSVDEPNLRLSNVTVTKDSIRSTYDNLEFINCDIQSLPDNLKVTNTLKFRDCKGTLPTTGSCNTLDIRGSNSFKDLSPNFQFDSLIAQGSNLERLPDSFRASYVNVVNTKVEALPSHAVVTELRCSDSLKIYGTFTKKFVF